MDMVQPDVEPIVGYTDTCVVTYDREGVECDRNYICYLD